MIVFKNMYIHMPYNPFGDFGLYDLQHVVGKNNVRIIIFFLRWFQKVA